MADLAKVMFMIGIYLLVVGMVSILCWIIILIIDKIAERIIKKK